MTQKMICIDNWDYTYCLTIGKEYEVRTEKTDTGTFYHVLDDNDEPLTTMVQRFYVESVI